MKKLLRVFVPVFGFILLANITLSSQSIFHNYPDVDSIYSYNWYDNVKDTSEIYIKEVVSSDSLIFFHYKRAEISSNLELKDKAHIGYSASDLQLNNTYYNWNGQEYMSSRLNIKEYDSEDRLIKNKQFYSSDGGLSWKPSELITYAAFEYDEPQVRYRFTYDASANQNLLSKVVRESDWNDEGKLDTVIFRSFDGNGSIGSVTHYHNTYEDSILLYQIRYNESDSEELLPRIRVDYQYFDALTILTYSDWDGIEWTPHLRYEYLYDQLDRLVEIKGLKYTIGDYVDDSQIIYFYPEEVSNTDQEITESNDFYFHSEASNQLGLYGKSDRDDNVEVLIYDSLGRLQYHTQMLPSQNSLDITIPKGNYWVNFRDTNQSIQTLKVWVN